MHFAPERAKFASDRAGLNPLGKRLALQCLCAFAPERAVQFSKFVSDRAGFNPSGKRLI